MLKHSSASSREPSSSVGNLNAAGSGPGWSARLGGIGPWQLTSAMKFAIAGPLAAYVEALGGRLEIIADSGDQRLAFTQPGTEAA